MDNLTSNTNRVGIIAAISAPLGFFVLALLIVEGFLGTVLVSAHETLQQSGVILCIWQGVGMFVLVVVAVVILVWNKPENLTLDKSGIIELQRIKQQVSDRLQRDSQVQEALREAMFYRTMKKHNEEIAACQKALSLDPNSVEAKIGLAVAKSYLDPKNLTESLNILDEVINDNQSSAKAFYNRACIRCLADRRKEDWLQDLKDAVKLWPPYRGFAQRDIDFDKFKSDPDFLAVVS